MDVLDEGLDDKDEIVAVLGLLGKNLLWLEGFNILSASKSIELGRRT